MKYLVLGASGFIGTNVINFLLNQTEDSVIAYDIVHKKILLTKKIENRITYITDNFSTSTDFEVLTKKVDIVIHLISTTTPASINVEIKNEIEDNIFPTLKLLDACVKNQVQKVVFVSSGGTVYGNIGKQKGDELFPTNPICSYGIQKLMIEKYLQLYNYKYNLKINIIRISNPYGPYQNPKGGVGAVTTFVYNALNDEKIYVWGDGNVVRDYIYIDDVIKGIINICQYKGDEKVFNLGTGCGYSLKDVLKIIEKVTEKKLNVIYKDARKVDLSYNVLNMELYNKTFSFPQFLNLEDGVRKLISYYKGV